MNIWFLLFILIHALNVAIHTAKHGEPLEGIYNVFSALLGALIGIFIVMMAIDKGF